MRYKVYNIKNGKSALVIRASSFKDYKY